MCDGWTDGKSGTLGEDNFVQVVTDGASNFVATGTMLEEKRTKLFGLLVQLIALI